MSRKSDWQGVARNLGLRPVTGMNCTAGWSVTLVEQDALGASGQDDRTETSPGEAVDRPMPIRSKSTHLSIPYLSTHQEPFLSSGPYKAASGDGGPGRQYLPECADAALADYLVTGNQRHFPRFWKKTKVITSREFISIAPHLIA